MDLKLAIFIVLIAGCFGATAYAAPAKGFRDCADCPEMIVVPAGSMAMGSTPAETDREQPPADVAAMEKPRHVVTITKPFAVGKFEITRGQYSAFVRATGQPDGENCFVWNESAAKWEKTPGITWHDPGFAQADHEPVVCVSWNEATAYAAWLAAQTQQPYRLLSEAEWEYAARSGTTAARPWTHNACRNGNVSDQTRAKVHAKAGRADAQAFFPCKDGYVFTAPVGSFKANAFGLRDMIGNVWEWTSDCEHPNYIGAPLDGSVWAGGDCTQRSNRGGSWADPMWRTRSALREWDPPGGRYVINGIRVARDLPSRN